MHNLIFLDLKQVVKHVNLEIAKQLESIIPEIYELEAKQKDGTITDDEVIDEYTQETQKNNFTKRDPVSEGAIDIFVKSNTGQNLLMSITEQLFRDDKRQGSK